MAHKRKVLSETHPDLCKEWHPEKNTDLTTDSVSPGSNKMAWWQCHNNAEHEWQAKIAARVQGSGCSFCRGQKVDRTNSLAVLYPNIAQEWHPDNQKTPGDVTPGHTKKVWWLCEYGHEYEATVNSRTNKKSGCPYCGGRKVNSTNCLANVRPDIAQEWLYAKNNQELTPQDVTQSSSKRVVWQCSKNSEHIWTSKVADRNTGYGCPYCSGKKPDSSTCLEAQYPDVAEQWHPTKNGKLTPPRCHVWRQNDSMVAMF